MSSEPPPVNSSINNGTCHPGSSGLSAGQQEESETGAPEPLGSGSESSLDPPDGASDLTCRDRCAHQNPLSSRAAGRTRLPVLRGSLPRAENLRQETEGANSAFESLLNSSQPPGPLKLVSNLIFIDPLLRSDAVMGLDVSHPVSGHPPSPGSPDAVSGSQARAEDGGLPARLWGSRGPCPHSAKQTNKERKTEASAVVRAVWSPLGRGQLSSRGHASACADVSWCQRGCYRRLVAPGRWFTPRMHRAAPKHNELPQTSIAPGREAPMTVTYVCVCNRCDPDRHSQAPKSLY